MLVSFVTWLPKEEFQNIGIIILQIPGISLIPTTITFKFIKITVSFTFVFQVSERCVVALVSKQMSSFNIPSSASFPRSISRYGQFCLRNTNT